MQNVTTESQYLEAAKKQLIAERHAAGYTLDELCELVPLSRSTLYRLEAGKAIPDLKQLDILATVYGMTLMDLMRRIDERADLIDASDVPTEDEASQYGLAAYKKKIPHHSFEDDSESPES